MGGETVTYRLRRSFLGYRRDDVVDALTAQRVQIEQLACSLERLWGERQDLAAELERVAGEHEAELLKERRRGMRAEAGRRVLAARLAAETERQALLIKLAAGANGHGLSKLEELLGARERLLGELNDILDSHASLLRRLSDEAREEGPVAAEEFELAVARLTGDRRVEIRELELPPAEVALSLARAVV